MAETADILTEDNQIVVLPDIHAGCSMADMANIDQTERAWGKLQETFGDTIIPLHMSIRRQLLKHLPGKTVVLLSPLLMRKTMVEWAFHTKRTFIIFTRPTFRPEYCI